MCGAATEGAAQKMCETTPLAENSSLVHRSQKGHLHAHPKGTQQANGCAKQPVMVTGYMQ
jgi:hypothetical protein